MTLTATAPVTGVERTRINAVVFASCLGTIIEWYDFLIYGTAAALVFNTLFFPNIDPLAGTLASLATYSVGFVAVRSAGPSSVILAIGSAARSC